MRLFPTDRKSLLRALLRVVALLLLLSLIGFFSLRSFTTSPGKSFRGTPPPVEASLTERLRASVTMLAGEIGPRSMSARSGLDTAEAWIREEWEVQGYEVIAHPYEVQGQTVRNLEIILSGADATLPAIVIGAHYDSWSHTPGADDNASGVAVLLELSRALREASVARTVRFVAFVNEEPPYFMTRAMGSLVYAKQLAEQEVELLGMVALETLGYYDATPGSQKFPGGLAAFYPDRGDFLAFVGMLSSDEWIERWIGIFREVAVVPSESLAAPSMIEGVNWSDHWSFETHGYPALMITDSAPYRNPNYHTDGDTPETLDYETLARVTEGLIETLRSVAEPKLPGYFDLLRCGSLDGMREHAWDTLTRGIWIPIAMFLGVVALALAVLSLFQRDRLAPILAGATSFAGVLTSVFATIRGYGSLRHYTEFISPQPPELEDWGSQILVALLFPLGLFLCAFVLIAAGQALQLLRRPRSIVS